MKVLILGGNRFFGKRLVRNLINKKHAITLLNRGNIKDSFEGPIEKIVCDRNDKEGMRAAIGDKKWDIVFDQVCFDYHQAKDACELFSNKVGKYIFTSSQSVYEFGSDIQEESFNPKKYTFEELKTSNEDYGEAKKQAEKAFAEFSNFPVIFARPCIVVGNDDYTGRFSFHVNQIKENRPIYFSNPDAKISFISSSLAADVLEKLMLSNVEGPINIASRGPISLQGFIQLLEEKMGKKAILSDQKNGRDESPYGITENWYMNCDKLKAVGIDSGEIRDWLPDLL